MAAILPEMILDAGCEITVNTAAASAAVLMLRPLTGPGQHVLGSEIAFHPETGWREYTDLFGNLAQRVIFGPGQSVITARCTVDTPDEIAVAPEAPFTLVQDLADDVMPYLVPSRYCQSDLMLKLAGEITADAAPGYAQVDAIRLWIHRNLRYEYGVSNASTSALETTERRAGICRDFCHLGIALCRALRIPARMVLGYLYLQDPMDLHTWFEAFVGGRWFTFDATQQDQRGNRIVIAYGRDAADVALMSPFGPVEIAKLSAWMEPAP